MASLPFPVSGIAYDYNSTTALSNVKVICRNITNNEALSVLTNSSGQYLFDLSNLTSGYSLGNEISLFVSYGNYYREVIFKISGSSKDQNLTLDTLIETAAMYCSIDDVRNFTGVSVAEKSDTSVYDMIRMATGAIDDRTGRTWKGIQTVTDEYYDGDDTDLLWLRQTDLVSVTALSIDQEGNGTYTTVSPTYAKVYSDGYIVMDRNSNITIFVAFPKAVKISYTYGNPFPSQAIKQMAILMVSNLLHYDPQREVMINEIFQRERWSVPGVLA